MFQATKLKQAEFKKHKSYEELLQENEQLLLDNRLLAEDIQYIKYIVDHPPKYRKGDIVSDRYLILEFKPFKEHFLNVKLGTLIAGSAVAFGLDLIFRTKDFEITKKYVDHFNRSFVAKPSWKYRVYDKKLVKEVDMYESEMQMATIM